MDTSNPAVFVNAELLPMYVGRRVRAVIQVLRSEGGTIVGKSTDERQLIIKGSPPPSPLTTFVEVIGIADSNQSIRAETFTNFGDNFDRAAKLGRTLSSGTTWHSNLPTDLLEILSKDSSSSVTSLYTTGYASLLTANIKVCSSRFAKWMFREGCIQCRIFHFL